MCNTNSNELVMDFSIPNNSIVLKIWKKKGGNSETTREHPPTLQVKWMLGWMYVHSSSSSNNNRNIYSTRVAVEHLQQTLCTTDDPHLFSNRAETKLEHTQCTHSHGNKKNWEIQEQRSRWKGRRRCQRHPYNLLSIRYFSSILLVIITLTLQILEKIVTLSRVIGIITREFYIRKFGFEVLDDNITWCSINKGDIMKVRVYTHYPN